ncbi:dual specificity protein kinase splB [Cajanus cajan]|uniref:dual specificity protein kinase splB n=1 Tax=Cajanus cajan TaxID=3821 RepID=UPI00098DD649|nr:dual specificity protein kinase splB [Cajanus cajan]XP_020228860.1 dual specificity protein kinase splB [Cajanus cajan]XP_020228863.1 dual specificity protein kinase splB [Cajanus cajan]XP_020228864.1 dual specificity protein kinase splB [Cajanus cajan]XP_020228865.1 dual specificity protein kinase splB [Cajanus cajan]XP_020228866.1 dual specificity protein kinase splB [Cajanus cajan]XP_029129471.1 dual specificity protein kinase splB [Cajanus cajan]
MEQSRFQNTILCANMEPRNDEYHQPGSQSVLQDHLNGIHTSRRPDDLNTSEVKPVLNYSIQTGEEFALEFMRDRVNIRKPVLSNASESNYTPGYMELKGILGISHAGSESGSDISMLSVVDKYPKEFDRMNTSLPGDRSNYGSIRSMPRTSLNQDNRQVVPGYGSFGVHDRSIMMKFLCSFGGRILPRPCDGKLRYVGGQTRILRIRKDISWLELMQKALQIYNQVHAIKYQLPGEDLDALVSVSSDEDLQNMMEECNHLEDREGSQKLRMFLFSMSDLEDAQFCLSSVGDDSEIQYVVAVNGMDLGSRKNTTMIGVSFSANDINELDRQSIDKETSRVGVDSIAQGNAPLTNNFDSSLSIQSSLPVLPTSSNSYEKYPPFYGDQMMHHGEPNDQYLINHGFIPSHKPVIGETPIIMPPHMLVSQQGILNEGLPPRGMQVQNSEIPATLANKIVDGSIQQGSGTGKSTELPSPAPAQLVNGYMKNNFTEASVVVTAPEGHSLHPAKMEKHQDYEETSTSSSAFGPAYVDSHSNAPDLSSLHPPPLPKRVYYSERISREQVELLNRSSKSDDTHSSQFLVSDLLSDVNPPDSGTESGDKLHDGNLPNLTEELGVTENLLHADGYAIDNGAVKHQIYKQLPDASGQMKSKLTEHVNPELKRVLSDNEGSKDVLNKDNVVALEMEIYSKNNYNKTLIDETKASKSDLPNLHQGSSGKHLDDPASNLPEVDWGDASVKESNDDINVQSLPVSLNGSAAIKDDSEEFPSNVVSKQAQGDILIDINDRFPREFFTDIFSKAVLEEDPSILHPLTSDGAGLSVNMENREPKRWSYFQKLAQEGIDNVSLMDQDHLGFSPAIGKVVGDNRDQHVTPLTTDENSLNHAESHLDFVEENIRNLHGRVGAETTERKSDYGHSQVNNTESMQFDAMMEHIRAQDSEYEVGKFEKRNSNLPPPDPSLGEFDPSTFQVIMNDDLEELKELGSGTFGTVYHGKWRGTDVAIKRIKKICFTGRSSEQERLTVEFWREAEILSKLHHPNVVAFYGVVQDGPGGTMATVAEYMVDGSLRHVLLRKDRYLDRRKRLIIAMDAAFGMEYLHSKNIVHFDLKCDNLLVNMKDPMRPICKVGDFGLSKIKRNTLVSGGVRGTLPWMAPELLNGSSNKVSEKVDVFSFGIVLWEILTGEEPYANMHYGAIIGGIVNNTLRPTIPNHCDPEWRTLMEQCWAPNPAARPSFTEIASRLRVMSAAASQTKTQGQKASK